MEHLYDITALQINNFNSSFNNYYNLWGLSGRDNILKMIVASNSHLPLIYIAKWLPSGNGHIMDHLKLEQLLLYMYLAVWKGL